MSQSARGISLQSYHSKLEVEKAETQAKALLGTSVGPWMLTYVGKRDEASILSGITDLKPLALQQQVLSVYKICQVYGILGLFSLA